MTSTGVPQKHNSPTQLAAEAIDRAGALSRVDGDGELMASLVDIFFTEVPAMMEAVRSAVAAGDNAKLEQAAHRLKGSVSIFGADDTTQTAFALEKIGRNDDIANAAEILVQLEQQMAKLQPALKQFRKELQPS